jgi:hypothetical protein
MKEPSLQSCKNFMHGYPQIYFIFEFKIVDSEIIAFLAVVRGMVGKLDFYYPRMEKKQKLGVVQILRNRLNYFESPFVLNLF